MRLWIESENEDIEKYVIIPNTPFISLRFSIMSKEYNSGGFLSFLFLFLMVLVANIGPDPLSPNT